MFEKDLVFLKFCPTIFYYYFKNSACTLRDHQLILQLGFYVSRGSYLDTSTAYIGFPNCTPGTILHIF